MPVKSGFTNLLYVPKKKKEVTRYSNSGTIFNDVLQILPRFFITLTLTYLCLSISVIVFLAPL